jgi:MoxR-like ATPase
MVPGDHPPLWGGGRTSELSSKKEDLMNVSEAKEAILLCREASVTAFLWGKHGLGKSSAVLQLAHLMGVGMIDMRCSQLEASDLRGLPDRDAGRTLYLPPADLPNEEQCSPSCSLYRMNQCKHKACEEREQAGETSCQGFLFLDELNRAEDDVLQAAFQLVYDKAIGTYKMPLSWSIVVAGNYTEGYTVNSFNDPAFLDRFCHLDLTLGETYMADWTDYMKKTCGDAADKILQFVGYNDAHLAGKVEADRGFSVMPSPRSWELAARVENVSRKQGFDRKVVQDVLSGLLGRELALQFERFSTDVLPSDVIARYKDVSGKVQRMSRNQLIGLVWGVVSNAKELGKKKDNEKRMTNVLDFMQHLAKHKERDMAVMLARQLCEGETKSLGGAVVSNPHLAKMAAKFKSKKGGRTWIQAINERPDLQALMSKVAFGSDK